MKIAILSDIHGNLPALHTVAAHIEAWRPDYVFVNGDVVNRGPKPAACLQFALEKQKSDGWQIIQGNHEAYVIGHSQADAAQNGRAFEINRLSYWTHQQLNSDIAAIASWPASHTLAAPDGSVAHITHASRHSSRDGIWPHTSINKARQQISPAPALFATAHIHHAFIRQVDETLIVNSGSAGQLCYGDTRASYAQVMWQNGSWGAKIVYLDYDMAQTDRDFHTSGFLDGAGPVARIIYHEWRTARPLLYPWIEQYQARVLASEIDLETAVTQYLTQMHI